ncbi:MAG TPA: 5'-3' exonuclease [Mycobacteriales bacterium]|nr:5'-3' exonuclease [Mycobacteriales bacterium]
MRNGTEDRLMLLDSASMYFRAFYGVPDTMVAPDGTPVNAVRGLLDYIARLVADRRPTQLVAAMDADWRPEWRVAAIPSYKAHRVADEAKNEEEVPDALSPQVPIIEQVLDALGICRVGVPGYEADDVIGTLATSATCPVEIVTGDRDLFQLVEDARDVTVLYIVKGVGNAELIDEAEITRRYDIPGRSYADFATMRGDPSDGLPGVPGVGEKTAAALLREFGTLDGILAAAQISDAGFPRGSHAKIVAAGEYIGPARKVVAVAHDVPIGSLDPALPRKPRDPDALDTLAERWALSSSVERVLEALGSYSRPV